MHYVCIIFLDSNNICVEFFIYIHAMQSIVDTIWLNFVGVIKQNQNGKLDN